jgi:tetratricopeptide (TPR) repeat protein
MPASNTYADLNDPTYRAALGHFQKGEWQPGLEALKGLAERFPHDPDLSAMVEENQVRANIDQYEREDRRRSIWRQAAGWAARGVVVALLGLAAWWGVQSYSLWFQNQALVAQQAVAAQARTFELAGKYANAQSMLRAGRLDEAQTLVNQIITVDPNYPGVQTLLGQVQARNALESKYNTAVSLVNRGDWAGALSLLQSIATADPGYKNVADLISLVQQQMLLDDLWAKTQVPYDAHSWAEAAAAYERMRAINPDYRRPQVEDRLFECYVNAGRAALAGQEDSLAALQTGEGYFSKALALRPQDPTVETESKLARLFLLSQDDFTNGRWTDVIVAVQVVYAADNHYAKSAARQTLYEAYIARGKDSMDAEQYDAALSDFQSAVALAEQDDQTVVPQYQAYLHAGDAYGGQKDFESAVLMYRKAVEVGKLTDRVPSTQDLAKNLAAADDAVSKSNFSLAYEKYQAAFYGSNSNGPNSTETTITHVVQPGEYLIQIATRFNSTVDAIVRANKLQNSRLIYPGQKLVVPVAP